MEKIINKLKEHGWEPVKDSLKELWFKRGYMIDLIGADVTGLCRIRKKISTEEYETIAKVDINNGEIDWDTLTHFNAQADVAKNEILKMLK